MDQSNQPMSPTTNPAGVVTKKYTIGEATHLDLVGPGTVTIIRGAAGVLAVTAKPEDFDRLEIKASGADVSVEFKGGLIRNRAPGGNLHYDVTLATLEGVKLDLGLAGEATNIDSRNLKIELRGGSTLKMTQLRAADLDAKIEDGGRLEISGGVVEQKIKLDAQSVYAGADAASEVTEIEASGKSEATVNVTRRLKVKASSGSTVVYSGDGIDLAVTTSDGSTFRHQPS